MFSRPLFKLRLSNCGGAACFSFVGKELSGSFEKTRFEIEQVEASQLDLPNVVLRDGRRRGKLSPGVLKIIKVFPFKWWLITLETIKRLEVRYY